MIRHLALLSATLLTGCGTIKSQFDDEAIRRNLLAANTYCTTLPRAYSGVAYDFCLLNAYHTEHGESPLALDGTVADMALSLVIDTALLPYTCYRQYSQGSLILR